MAFGSKQDIGDTQDWQGVGKGGIAPKNIIDGGTKAEAFVGNHDTVVRGTTGGANISKPTLDTKQSYIVGKPGFTQSTLGGGRVESAQVNKQPVRTSSEVDQAAKWEYPNVTAGKSEMPPSTGEPNI